MIKWLIQRWRIWHFDRANRKIPWGGDVRVPNGPPRTEDGHVVGEALYGESDGVCSAPTKGNAGL